MTDKQPIQLLTNIPVNLITGFLGAGKTTLIRRLLANKPASEKWAVLVNEFGEVGVDGALLKTDEIAVTEVAGGCMCCAAGLPSKAALNQLIRDHKPDRILIEPTGLAHPQQVFQQFTRDEYRTLLDMQAVVCVVDPWSVGDPQFTSLPAFRDQIEIADILVGSKMDQADTEHQQAFRRFGEGYANQKRVVEGGPENDFPIQWLTESHSQTSVEPSHQASHATRLHNQQRLASPKINTAQPSERAVTQIERSEKSEDFGYSCGWRIPNDWYFEEHKLLEILDSLSVPRIKGIVKIAPDQWLMINRMRDTLSCESVESRLAPECARLEMISIEPADWSAIELLISQTRID